MDHDDVPPGDATGGADADHDAAAGPTPAERAARRAQLDREWRLAMVIAVALLVVGQVLLLLGWWPVALLAVAVPGTAAAVVLLRRWKRLGA